MLKEYKFKRTKKIKKNGNKRKNNKMMKLSKTSSLQKGGNNNSKEKFEVKRLADIDYSQFSITKYLDTDIDWGSSPGPPPTDCCIL